jgi:hypothetical protein
MEVGRIIDFHSSSGEAADTVVRLSGITGQVTSSGSLVATTSLQGATAVISGQLSAASAAITGAITAASLTLTGLLSWVRPHVLAHLSTAQVIAPNTWTRLALNTSREVQGTNFFQAATNDFSIATSGQYLFNVQWWTSDLIADPQVKIIVNRGLAGEFDAIWARELFATSRSIPLTAGQRVSVWIWHGHTASITLQPSWALTQVTATLL